MKAGSDGPNEGAVKLIRIHSTADDWPKLRRVYGIGRYPNRALMMSGGVAVVHEDPDDVELRLLLEDYRKFGIGPDEVIYVRPKTGSLYADLLADVAAVKRILQLVEQGYRLEMFCSSEAGLQLVDSLGLDWDLHTANPRLEHYVVWADKISLRRRLGERGYGGQFFANKFAKSLGELREFALDFARNNGGCTVFKRGDLASSEGMAFTKAGELPPDEWMHEYWDPRTGLVVETAMEHHAFSLTYDVGEDGAVFRHSSLQWQGHSRFGAKIRTGQLLAGDLDHQGNMVGPRGWPLGPVSRVTLGSAVEALAGPMSVIHESGFRGKATVDLAAASASRVAMLEVNPRASHSQYVASARDALSSHYKRPLFVLGANMRVDDSFRSYSAVRGAVRNFAKAGKDCGVLFFHTQLPAAGIPKVGVLAFGRTHGLVQGHYERVQNVLGPKDI